MATAGQTFFTEEAKTKIVAAVRAVEASSSAEIVVSLRSKSDDYREIDYAAGLLLGITTLAILMYHPAELDADLMPVETLVAFAVGSILVNKIGALKRLLTPKKRRAERSLRAARANFVEAGVSRTRDRSGILVFVSELERMVCVVPDIGIEPEKLGDAWRAKMAALEKSGTDLDVTAFVAALTAFGPVLGAMYPRKEDDVNELPDEPLTGGAS